MAAPGKSNMWELYQEWRHTPKAQETLRVGLIGLARHDPEEAAHRSISSPPSAITQI